MADNLGNQLFPSIVKEKSLDQWVLDTIEPILIIIYEIMKQIMAGLVEIERYVN